MIEVILLILAAAGHLILWVSLVNRAHGLGIKRRWVDCLTLTCIAMFALMPIVVLIAFVSILAPQPTLLSTMFYAAARTYILACVVICVVATIQRLLWRFHGNAKAS